MLFIMREPAIIPDRECIAHHEVIRSPNSEDRKGR